MAFPPTSHPCRNPSPSVTIGMQLQSILCAIGSVLGISGFGPAGSTSVSVSDSAVAPAPNAVEVTPNDSTNYPNCRSIWVGGGGDLVVTMAATGGEVTFAGVPAGTWLPIVVTQVKAATTATNIVIVW